ncbi:DNA-binding protein HU [subsurface metagenome]
MNKAELVEAVSDKAGITKNQAGSVIDAITDTVKETLSKGERIALVGFGTFHVRQRKAREGRNPRTGKKLEIPAKKVAKFRAGKNLREAVR